MSSRARVSRRDLLLTSAAALGAGTFLLTKTSEAKAENGNGGVTGAAGSAEKSDQKVPAVITLNGRSLEYQIIDGVKVFHLIAEEVEHEFTPGLTARCWGYNGRVHGPTIEATEGDRVRIYVTNKLPAPTTIHWHGIIVPNGMDGVSGLTQKPISPGETFKYEFTINQHGTFMYHPHFDEMVQMSMGLMGLFIVHPKVPKGPRVDRDYAMLLSEWKIVPGTRRPDPNEMTDFNVLTINARCFPGTAPLIAKQGDRIRIRIGNLSPMEHHPIHMHGFFFKVVATDGGEVPESAQIPETTVLVPVGTTRTVEFEANAPGDWPIHCHMTHHTMNQMGHNLANMTGVKTSELDREVQKLIPGYMSMGQAGMGDMMQMGAPKNSVAMLTAKGPYSDIAMGGMFTVIKVRANLEGTQDPGWYASPDSEVAKPASPDELKRDGIQVPKKT